jgi:fumarylpyruvate hydrolase
MTKFAFPLLQPSLAIKDSDVRFPIRRVWCVGRNYLAHVREMGNDERETPFFFSKQPDMVVSGGGTIHYPSLTKNYQFDGELVVALKGGGENISTANAPSLIFGHAVGLDMTRRDLQKLATEKGKPWEISKSSEQSGPVGTLTPSSTFPGEARIRVLVNGQTEQESNIRNMIWNVPEIIAKLSQQVSLAAGDIIFTGTPEGVGPVVSGDRLMAEVDGLPPLEVAIA